MRNQAIASVAAAAAAVIAAVTAIAVTPRTAETPAPVIPAAAPPAALSAAPGSWTGVYAQGAPASYLPVSRFAAAAGAHLKIAGYYSALAEPFKTRFAVHAHAHGTVPLIQLEPTRISLASIAAGKSDPVLRRFALAVAAYRSPVIVSFAHEMNGPWYSWGSGHSSPAVFIAAWRHVHGLFAAAGAHNVTWLWVVNVDSSTGPELAAWWPGARYVTWAGITGYFVHSYDTFGGVFGPTIREVRQITGKPVLIDETGIGTTRSRDTQIRSLFRDIRAYRLLGFVYFDIRQHNPPYHQDWRLEDDPAALTAFRRAARSAAG